MENNEYIVALIIFFVGILCCKLIKLAEARAIIDCSGKKHYTRNGKIYYCLVFLIWISYVILQNPHNGMAAFKTVFSKSTNYGTTLFSLNGLYTDEMEPLFLLWAYLVRLFTDNYKIFLVLSCAIIYFCILRFISEFILKADTAYVLVLFVPVLLDYAFGIRYGLAVAYCLIVLIAIKKKHYIKAIVFMILAAFTHFVAFAFIMFIASFVFFKKILGDKIYSVKTIVILGIGVFAFSQVAYSLYMTFRVSYRVLDEIQLRNILSYFPYVIFVAVILYFNKKYKEDKNNGICVLCAYFNAVMIPITIQWGIYRLPYIFIIPIAVELVNCLRKHSKNERLLTNGTLFIIYLYAYIKLLTMGVQNCSLLFEWVFCK